MAKNCAHCKYTCFWVVELYEFFQQSIQKRKKVYKKPKFHCNLVSTVVYCIGLKANSVNSGAVLAVL